MRDFVRFWLFDSFAFAIASLRKLINLLEQSLAIKATFSNISQPLFQDFTWQGRIIGFCLRSLRIVFGGFLYLLVWIFGGLAYAAFVVSPAVFAYAGFGYVTTQTSQEVIR